MMFLTKNTIRSLIILVLLGMVSPFAFAVRESSESTGQMNPTEIQKALAEAGFYKGSVDGVVGSKTKEAIRKFQEANNLKVDGVCGPKTWEKLKAYLEEAAEIDATSSAPAEEVTTTPTLDEASDDYGYSEFDSMTDAGEDDSDELKQKLVS